MSAVDVHFFAPFVDETTACFSGRTVALAASVMMTGLCGVWHSLQASPAEWSAETTCGKAFGLAVLASWHLTQSLAVSSFSGVTPPGSSACVASGPWQASQFTPACLPL